MLKVTATSVWSPGMQNYPRIAVERLCKLRMGSGIRGYFVSSDKWEATGSFYQQQRQALRSFLETIPKFV